MKPDGAMTLAIGMDVSECAIEHALEMLGVSLKAETRKTAYIGDWYILRVPSQSMSCAQMALARMWSPIVSCITVKLDFEYQEDEWSLSKVMGDNKASVWSKGA